MKIMSVVGARPNFMKIAPILSAIETFNNEAGPGSAIRHCLVHTGQHYDNAMSDAFFADLDMPQPDEFLGAGSGSQAAQVAAIMQKFEPVLLRERPSAVVVVGDVNSTLACSLVAAKARYDGSGERPLLAHVEAGLRSFDRSMPEEINRLVTDSLADLLFTPSEDADRNLLREGAAPEKILRVGNVMIDTLARHIESIRGRSVCKQYGLRQGEYAFVTLHRPSNVDDRSRLDHIMDSLARLSAELDVLFPVHPRTRKQLAEFGLWERARDLPHLLMTGPLGYCDAIGLVDSSRFVLTDSGGLQEETTWLGIPCLTLRPNTERPVTITRGTNRLTSIESLDCDIRDALEGVRSPGSGVELWDGRSAGRIVAALAAVLSGDALSSGCRS